MLRGRNIKNAKSLGGARSVSSLLAIKPLSTTYGDQNSKDKESSTRRRYALSSNRKAIVTLMLLGISLLATYKLHTKASSSLYTLVIDIPASPTPTTTTSNDIVVAHCTEDLKWLDQLYNFDPLVCSHVRIYIYSKCNAEIDLNKVIPLTANCATIKQVNNCGTQEYAYFQFILDHYESMSPMVSFIQGDALTENPHIIYDMLVNIPGTTYKDLARHVRDGWFMEGVKENPEMEIMHNLFPYLEDKEVWLTSWRGMFAASREQIKLHSPKSYFDINKTLCSKKCKYIHCNMEVWFAPLFGCDPQLYGNDNQEECKFGVHDIAPKLFAEDHMKDSFADGNGDTRTTIASTTHWTKCGDKTVYHSTSAHNGVLLCTDESRRNSQSRTWGGIVSSYSELVLNEKWIPNLSNLTFQKPSQWKMVTNTRQDDDDDSDHED